MILEFVKTACQEGARLSAACEFLGLDPRTLQRWRAQEVGEDRRAGPKSVPANKLSEAERKKVLEVVNRPEHSDLSVKQIVPLLADQGVYLASESTMFRILREEGQMQHRSSARPSTHKRPDELVASRPNQVWSWDITYMKSEIAGEYYYAYVIMDVFSRKVVGHVVHDAERDIHAASLVAAACAVEGVTAESLVIHSDNGAPMKGATMRATLERLGVASSFSRPGVSDDNPYSESLFRTMKYRPEYPERPFPSLEAAANWMDSFVDWYNHEHRHSAIRFVTPAQRHDGREIEILAQRRILYERARRNRPERWTGRVRNWNPISVVVLNRRDNEATRRAG
jgi:transposase InsO family protein